MGDRIPISDRPLLNRLLNWLPAGDLALLTPHLQRVPLLHTATLRDQGDDNEAAYFPISGMISLVHLTKKGEAVETGCIGYENGFGLLTGLGIRVAPPTKGQVQVPGEALKIDGKIFYSAASKSGPIREMIGRNEGVLLSQFQTTLACNALHKAEARLARWILHASDLCQGAPVLLTQQVLSMMLGVRRTTVTLMAQKLRLLGLIGYSRGRISIIDRKALEREACDCYRQMRRVTEQFLSRPQFANTQLVAADVQHSHVDDFVR